ncbi:mitochondrial inner membrane protease ATP23 homolog isoform X4 [Delphinus delphis]|uniref:mitochondrial inner membrane protease ATP23 homolog isoform X4 n=1 Tax=Delphinus delphis TaxID=9728 RepID=UPI0028C4AF10|nr:mitochondrial inner membrane protease ATP23 homolog isoform X4 [Delphinus delphis]
MNAARAPLRGSSCSSNTSGARSSRSGWLRGSHSKGSSPASSPTTRSASLCSCRLWRQDLMKLRFFMSHCRSNSARGKVIDPYVKLLLDAMKHSGCAVNRERHFSCEDCNGNVSGGFDASVSQIVLCQNNICNQAHMNRVVTHELIHAFDHCRAHVDWFTNVRHLACSEVRAANLSGDCSLLNEIFRLHFGLKRHHQTCVRDRAIRSILAVRNISKEVAQKAVDEVFESCFNDHEPFGRIPHNKTYARYAHRDFQNRDRYYSNI